MLIEQNLENVNISREHLVVEECREDEESQETKWVFIIAICSPTVSSDFNLGSRSSWKLSLTFYRGLKVNVAFMDWREIKAQRYLKFLFCLRRSKCDFICQTNLKCPWRVKGVKEDQKENKAPQWVNQLFFLSHHNCCRFSFSAVMLLQFVL